MSYDLFFRARYPGAALTFEHFSEYFGARRHYRMVAQQASYENGETGVYFSFSYHGGGQESTPHPGEAEPTRVPVTFNLNFIRPHVFGLEAEPEVASFVHRFDLLVSDPQEHGMGEGEYSREGFLAAWNAGNSLAYRVTRNRIEESADHHALPAERIEACWRWNLSRQELQSALEDVFVPIIVFLDVDGALHSVVVWGDGMPIAMPAVDFVLVPKGTPSWRGVLRRREEFALAPWIAVDRLLNRFPRERGALPYYLLRYVQPPTSVLEFVKRLRPTSRPLKVVALDRILDQEIMESAGSGGG